MNEREQFKTFIISMLSAAVVGSTLASSSDANAGDLDCGEGKFRQVIVTFPERVGFNEFTSCTFNEAPPPPPVAIPDPLPDISVPELPDDFPGGPPGDPIPF